MLLICGFLLELGLGMEEVEMELEDDGDMEMEMQLEEARWPEVACPYCYEDHDVASLCAHLEEDHPYEPHAAPCPICAEKITRDMLNHITMQHGYLFKNGRRLHRFIIPESHALSFLSRDLRDAHLQALLGGFAMPNAEEPSKTPVPIPDDTPMLKETPAQPWESSIDSSLTSEEREQKRKQATDRAIFVQGLVLSTLFVD